MPFLLERNDLTGMRVDAIVCPTRPTLEADAGGLDGMIHAAAGPQMQKACRRIGLCPTGEARLTRGYDLPCRYVIHTVGPVWHGGTEGEEALLRACYRSCLALAQRRGFESLAIPLIAAGNNAYPKDQALSVAADEIRRFLQSSDMTVYLVLFGREAVRLGRDLSEGLREYIDDCYVQRVADISRGSRESRPRRVMATELPPMAPAAAAGKSIRKAFRPKPAPRDDMAEYCYSAADMGLDERLRMRDESFQQMLMRKIDESGMTDAQCYKLANVDRKLFSKIRGDVRYQPSKKTALSFAIALRMNPAETAELLMKAGFALSHSSVFDIIVEYFIERGEYDIFTINEALFAFDQPTLS